jgi:hypothetical protein
MPRCQKSKQGKVGPEEAERGHGVLLLAIGLEIFTYQAC